MSHFFDCFYQLKKVFLPKKVGGYTPKSPVANRELWPNNKRKSGEETKESGKEIVDKKIFNEILFSVCQKTHFFQKKQSKFDTDDPNFWEDFYAVAKYFCFVQQISEYVKQNIGFSCQQNAPSPCEFILKAHRKWSSGSAEWFLNILIFQPPK